MKKFLIFLFFVCSNSFAAITDGKFGINQIFDVQYWWNGTTLNASNFIAPYNKNFQTVTVSAGQYFQFFPSTTNPGKYGLKLMNSNGTQHSIVHDHGDITALGNGAIFYIGSGFFGNVITTAQGYSYGASAQFTNMDTSVSSTDLNNYTFASTTPLAAGQTAAPAGPPPPAPTAIYMNNATVRITRAIPTTSNSPPGEGPNNAFDNNTGTKYLNFDKKNAGVTVELNTGRVVTGFTVTTANDFSGRDPTSYKLYGSNDGVTWILIKQDTITLSDSRFTTSSVISVGNTTAYAYYFMLFPTTKAGDGCGLNCDSMQIAELTYYYDANSTVTSTATNSTIVDPVNGAGPSVQGGTITQSNAPSNQIIGSGGGSVNITAGQQSRVNNWNKGINQIPNNYLYIDQVSGNFNNITITQTTSTGKNRIEATLSGSGSNTISATQSGTNYLNLNVSGFNNNVSSQQSNNSLSSNYKETTVIGNSNIINTNQKDNANHIMFTTVTGNNNSVTAVQEGTGGHYLENKLTGNGHSVLVNQSGNTQNNASIDLTNSGGPASVDLQQSGGKSFNIIQSCINPAGCNTVVRQ